MEIDSTTIMVEKNEQIQKAYKHHLIVYPDKFFRICILPLFYF